MLRRLLPPWRMVTCVTERRALYVPFKLASLFCFRFRVLKIEFAYNIFSKLLLSRVARIETMCCYIKYVYVVWKVVCWQVSRVVVKRRKDCDFKTWYEKRYCMWSSFKKRAMSCRLHCQAQTWGSRLCYCCYISWRCNVTSWPPHCVLYIYQADALL